jgi:putative cardiolipin synthase
MKSVIFQIGIIVFLILFISSCTSSSDQVPAQEKDFCSQIHETSKPDLSNELLPYDSLMNQRTGVYVLEDGGGSLVTRAWLCENAEKSIDIQYFIFSTDNVGLIACDYLVRAADRGIKVRIIVDDIMVEAGVHEILTMDSHENIEIKVYNPGVNLGKNIFKKLSQFAFHFNKSNQRMHNKTFIVDNKVAITGGRNIADEYFDYDHEYNFRDRDVLLIGKSPTDITRSFEDYWNSTLCQPVANLVEDKTLNSADTTRFERLHQYACNPDNFWPQVKKQIKNLPKTFDSIRINGKLIWTDSVQFISDMPGKNDGTNGLHGGGITTDVLTDLIKNAHSTVDIQSPYLIVTKEGLSLFEEAVSRGVEVNILTNSLASTDNVEAFSAYQKCRSQLLNAGVKLFEYKPDAAIRIQMLTGVLQKEINYAPIFGMHAKSMVVDHHITVIGTFNLDPRSANLNTECFALINDTTIAKSVLNGMQQEYLPENSWQTTNSFNPDSEVGKWKRLKTFTRKLVPKSIL